MTKRLVVMRHAQAARPGGVADHDRPLASDGLSEAALTGQWIGLTVGQVDSVLSSTAARTVETASAIGLASAVSTSRVIYSGWTDEVLDEIRLTDPEVSVLLVIGHSPVVGRLVLDIADESSDGALLDHVRKGFPTAAAAVLNVPGSWADLGPQCATFSAFFRP